MRNIGITTLFAVLATIAGCASGDDADLVYGDVENNGESEFQGDPAFYLENAQNYYNTGDYPRALTQFRRMLNIEPENISGRMGEAFCLFNIGRNLVVRGALDEAGKRYEAAEKILGDLWSNFGRNIEKSTVEGTGFRWKTCLGLAMIERSISGLERIRIDLLDDRLNQSKDEKTLGDRLARRKKLQNNRDHYNEIALDKFRLLAGMEHAAPEAYRNLGDMELVVGHEDEAERAYLRYLEITRSSVERWEKRRKDALDFFETKANMKVAMREIDRKRQVATNKTAAVLERLAEIKFNKGNFSDSLTYLLDAIEIEPERYEFHVPVAECYYELGNYKKGLEHINEYIERTPGFDDDTRKAYKLRARFLKHVGSEEKANGK